MDKGLTMRAVRSIPPGDRPAGNVCGTRSIAMARRGMVATSQALASASGLAVLQEGGNAIDAAVTAAAVLSVIEPTMTGVGGDLFALVHDARDGAVHALNASGRTGRGASSARLREHGLTRLPSRGALSVTVPGAVAGWVDLLARHGTIPLSRALAPAIAYAREGFPVAEIAAGQWQDAEAVLAADPHAASVFLPRGRAPRAGEVFANPLLAATLERVAHGGVDGFYRGPVASAIASRLAADGGLVDEVDLGAHATDWVTPIRTTFRGCEVFEMPPNTQGFVALEMLNILEHDDLEGLGHNTGAYLHLLVEAARVAFADRDAHLSDAAWFSAGALETLTSKAYAGERRRGIDASRAATEVRAWVAPSRASGPVASPPSAAGDTVYLAAADSRGNAVSLVQSLFECFGSAVVVPGTGVVLQNRGSLFVLDETHPNRLGANKRPMHTLIPAMVFRDGQLWLSFGVMGGDLQPQGHVQVLVNLLAFGMNLQEAGEAARIRYAPAGVAVESGVSREARAGLAGRGHTVIETSGVFGGFQGILVDSGTGVLMGGSDPRKDGLAIGH
jgi:gamma-glutamyltranspeptidase/glutathione hydrolase